MSGYRGRDDDLMIELQAARDSRSLDEMVMNGPQLEAAAERDEAEWRAIWEKQGYSVEQCRQLRSAFAHLESAWLVFWEGRQPEGALWRLIDAAGLLAEALPLERAESTGRGYRIERIARFCKVGHRWDGRKPPTFDPAARSPLPSVDPVRPKRTAPVALDPRRAFSRLQKAEIFLRCNGHCAACGIELPDDWHADHILPHAWGGLTEVRNGQALCIPCNQRKRDHVLTVEEGEE